MYIRDGNIVTMTVIFKNHRKFPKFSTFLWNFFHLKMLIFGFSVFIYRFSAILATLWYFKGSLTINVLASNLHD